VKAVGSRDSYKVAKSVALVDAAEGEAELRDRLLALPN
jgi:hypothetical protein